MKGRENENLLKKYQDYLDKEEKIRRLYERPGTVDEGNQAEKALKKIQEKIEEMERTYGFSRENNCNVHSRYKVNYNHYSKNNYDYMNETESEKYDRLGIIYAIFGDEFKITLHGYDYKVCFKEILKPNYAFCRVLCDIYENDQEIAYDVVIGFWPFHSGDIECGDMEFSAFKPESIRKYEDDLNIYNKIMNYMMFKWNNYFGKERKQPQLNDSNFDESFNTFPLSDSEKSHLRR